jgi:hypothetical protein
MRDRRARSLGSAIEILEGRGLLSAVAPILSAPLEPSSGSHGAADIDSSHSNRTGAASDLTSSSSIRSDADSGGAARRSTYQDVAVREIVDPLQSDTRRTDSATADESPENDSDLMSELVGGGASDSAGVASAVGWGPGVMAPVFISLANPSDRIGGLDERLAPSQGSAGAAASQLESVTNVAIGFETASEEENTAPGGLIEPLRTPPLPSAATAREALELARANLLEGALHSEWETVDRELRQFLTQLDVLPDIPAGHEAGTTWLVWIGAATVLILTRTSSYGPGRFFRRPVPVPVGASSRHPMPVGPWPLGPP